MLRILIVDDDALYRSGLVGLLSGQSDIKVVAQAGSVRQALALTLEYRPDVVLMDFTLPDGTGLSATRAILERFPQTTIVFLSVFEDNAHLFAAIRSGARGYLTKSMPVSRLLELLRGTEHGEAAILPTLTSQIMTEIARRNEGTSDH